MTIRNSVVGIVIGWSWVRLVTVKGVLDGKAGQHVAAAGQGADDPSPKKTGRYGAKLG